MDYRALGGHKLGTCAVLTLAVTFGCGGKDKKGPKEPTTQIGTSAPQALAVPKLDAELCDAKGKKIATFDLNRDNKPDVWKLYRSTNQGGTTVEVMTCKQYDYDHDGRKDYIVLLADTGEVIAEEFDFTFEGHIDTRQHYDKKTGKIYLVERDSDHDAKPDIWEKFDLQGTIESVRQDRNGDGKPDLWEQYEKGTLIAILYDNDFDNRVDRKEVRATSKPPPKTPTPGPGATPPPADTPPAGGSTTPPQ